MSDETQPSKMELHNAIHKIEEFSRKQDRLQKNPLQKSISIVRSLIFSNDKLKKDKEEMLRAIEIIIRERHRIQRLSLGTPAEQKLADSYTKAVEAFNSSLDGKKERQLPKIELPYQNTLKKHFPAKTDQQTRMINSKAVPVNLSKQYTELFHMKVLALLERYGIATNPEARQAVKTSPILSAVEEDPAICTLSQTISLFPGQIVVVKGNSELDLQTQTICKLFPDTFSISLEWTQTGFPYPSQRTGWALANQLIPACHRPDLLGNLALFYQRKKGVVSELQPQGQLINKAKRLLNLKRQAFEQNKRECLQLHKELVQSVINAAPQDLLDNRSNEIVEGYFKELEDCSSPFERLSKTYQSINEHFIAKQQTQLIHTILNDLDDELQAINPTQRRASAESILESTLQQDYSECKFVQCLGKIFGNASKKILLQYFSEDLAYEPPTLSSFEKGLQSAAFKHGQDFLDELESDTLIQDVSKIRNNLIAQIEWDISHLNSHMQLSVADTLDKYFAQRYQVLAN